MGDMKRGMSTVLGALIFVCILLTCIVPLWFTKQQADLMYDKAVAEARQFDIDRASEDLLLSTIDGVIHLKNIGSISVDIVRVWFNDTREEVSLTLPIFGQGELTFPDLNGTYNVMVTTDRGRKFTTELSYIPEPIYTIYIEMASPGVQLYALITFLNPDPEGSDIIVFDGNLLNNQGGYLIIVPFTGYYQIIVTQFYDLVLFDDTILVDPDALVII